MKDVPLVHINVYTTIATALEHAGLEDGLSHHKDRGKKRVESANTLQ